jgi:hypothetical protein
MERAQKAQSLELRDAAREQDWLFAQVPYHLRNELDMRNQNDGRETPIPKDPSGHIE